MTIKICIILILSALQGCRTTGGVNQNNSQLTKFSLVNSEKYRDPDGAFTINVPEHWKVERNKIEEQWVRLVSMSKHAWSTFISLDEYEAARLQIISLKQPGMDSYPADLKEMMLAEVSKPLFEGWLGALKKEARVEQIGDVYKTQLADKDAFRQDVTYYRGDRYDPRKGYGAFLLGNNVELFISVTGSDEAVRVLEKILATLQVEPAK